jgi:hypothetical protein
MSAKPCTERVADSWILTYAEGVVDDVRDSFSKFHFGGDWVGNN